MIQSGQTASFSRGANGLAWFGGTLAAIGAAVIAAILALLVATAVVVMALMGGILLTLTGLASRSRRTARAPADPDLIEARHVGGHSWVAYGWDRPAL